MVAVEQQVRDIVTALDLEGPLLELKLKRQREAVEAAESRLREAESQLKKAQKARASFQKDMGKLREAADEARAKWDEASGNLTMAVAHKQRLSGAVTEAEAEAERQRVIVAAQREALDVLEGGRGL